MRFGDESSVWWVFSLADAANDVNFGRTLLSELQLRGPDGIARMTSVGNHFINFNYTSPYLTLQYRLFSNLLHSPVLDLDSHLCGKCVQFR